MNYSKNYNKTPSNNSSTQKDKSSLSPLRLKNTGTKAKENTNSKMRDKQNKSYTNLLSFQNIKSFAKPQYNQKSFQKQNLNNSQAFHSARNKLFIYHQKPSQKQKSYSHHENKNSSYTNHQNNQHSFVDHEKNQVNTSYNKIKQMKKNYQIQLKQRDRNKMISPEIKYFKNKQISFQQDNINSSYQNNSIHESSQIQSHRHISPFKGSKQNQQNINMSGSKSTIQLLQSNSRNLSNEEISFQISQNYDLQNSGQQFSKVTYSKDFIVERKNRDHELIQALKLQNQSLKSTLGLYRQQNQCLNSMNMNYKIQSKKSSQEIKKNQTEISQKNTKIQTLESQLKQYADIFSKLQDLELMQEKMLKQNEKLKNKAKMNEGILQNIANMVRMSGYYHGQSNSKQGSIINNIKSLTQIFFLKNGQSKIK